MNQIRTKFARLPLAACAMLILPVIGFGQTSTGGTGSTGTTSATATCTTAPQSIMSFSIERTLTLSNILASPAPTIPPTVLAMLTGGQEIRTRLIYNPQQNTVTDTTFLVAMGSPLPTPLSTDVSGATINSYVLNITNVFTSCQPTPSLLIVGTLSASSGVFGNLQGAPAAISVGYTTATPPVINNVVEVVAGQVVAYSSSAQGTLTFPAAPTIPPGTSNSAPVIAITPALPTSGPFQVYTNPWHVDASGTTDPNGLALTYMWSSDKPVVFVPSANVPSPNIQFSGRQDYNITLTVMNSAGASSSKTFTVTYLGR